VVIDIIIVILLIYALVLGLRKGVVMQVVELLAVLLGVYGAYKFSHMLAGWVQGWGINAEYVGTVSFICMFIAVVVAVSLLGKVVHGVVQTVMMGWLNRLLGAAFALLKILLLVVAALRILDGIQVLPQSQVQESKMYKPLIDLAPYVFKYLDINKLKDAADSIDKEVEKMVPV
jgi:membrane protein required for colicin V production